MNLESANDQLVGYTDLLSLAFTSEPDCWSCTVSITLLSAKRDGSSIVLTCSDASRFSLSRFGGGMTQLLCLRIRSVAHEGRDRVRFVVEDLEREAIWFECDDFSIAQQ